MTIPLNTTANTTTTAADCEDRRQRFDRYVVPLLPQIHRLVDITSTDPDTVDDNYQEVLIHLFLNIHRYDPNASLPATWIQRVASNKMAKINRHQRALQTQAPTIVYIDAQTTMDIVDEHHTPPDDIDSNPVATTAAPDGIAQDRASPTATPDATLPAAPAPPCSPALYPRIYTTLQSLTPLDRSIIILYAQGASSKDIAQELNTRRTIISQHLSRLKQRLKRELRPLIFTEHDDDE